MKNNNKISSGGGRNLTKAEEQIMQAIWQKGKSFLKDVLEALPEPQPHSNTVATLLKILIEKGFVKAELSGRNYLYSATITKDEYSRNSLKNLVSNYFNGSYSNAVSFLVNDNKISLEDLELLVNQLKKK